MIRNLLAAFAALRTAAPRLTAVGLSLALVNGCSRDPKDSPIRPAGAAPAATSARPEPTAPSPGGSSSAQIREPAGASACSPGCSSIERCKGGRCVPSCPEGEVYVPATGPEGFEMGRGRPGAADQRHKVILTKPFCMDATEVTVAAYKKCVEAGMCTIPQLNDANSNYRPEFKRDDHPLNMVNFMQATTYCESRGQALPTEAQWEWAAGHGDGRTYPWGSEPHPSCENNYADFTPGGSPHEDPAGNVGCHGGGSSKVKAHPLGKTSWPDGDIFDLGGNVWEWTADCYLPYEAGPVTDPSPQKHPSIPGECYVRSLRGGGWNRSKEALKVHWRAASKKTYRVPGLGFRCVRNPS